MTKDRSFQVLVAQCLICDGLTEEIAYTKAYAKSVRTPNVRVEIVRGNTGESWATFKKGALVTD